MEGAVRMTGPLAGKVVLITGASSGIGRATAQRLSREGALLALAARSIDKLESLRDSIGSDSTLLLPIDLRDPSQVDAMVSKTLNHFDARIDAFLANAGVYVSGEVADGNPDVWDQAIAVNVSSVFRAAGAALAAMRKQKSGDIIVTSSIAGHQALALEPVYSATKHAVQSFVHGLRRQAAPYGVRVGAVAPGTVLNELWGYTDPETIRAKVEARQGITSEDVAEAIVFMLTRPAHVTIRDLVILPQSQDI
jgi:ribitol 2-dehydrogenase